MGFSPGFAYLEGSRARCTGAARGRAAPGGAGRVGGPRQRPRRRLSHARHPAAGTWSDAPASPVLRRDARPTPLLAPGDRVRFTVAGAGDPVEPGPVPAPAWSLPSEAPRPVFEVVAAGLRAVVQDGGRRGVAAVGVPAAGPADPVSFDLANRLVGERGRARARRAHRRRDPAALPRRVPRGGRRRRARGPRRRQPGAGRTSPPLGRGSGARASVASDGGCRTYVSVAGGFLGPAVVREQRQRRVVPGSAPDRSRRGSALHAGAWTPPLGDHLVAGAATDVDAARAGGAARRPRPAPRAVRRPTRWRGWPRRSSWSSRRRNRVGLRLRADDGRAGLRGGRTGASSTPRAS